VIGTSGDPVIAVIARDRKTGIHRGGAETRRRTGQTIPAI